MTIGYLSTTDVTSDVYVTGGTGGKGDRVGARQLLFEDVFVSLCVCLFVCGLDCFDFLSF